MNIFLGGPMFLKTIKTVNVFSLLAASLFISGCGTKVGIQIEKALGNTDFVSINDGAKYTNNPTLKIEMTTLNQFYSLRT